MDGGLDSFNFKDPDDYQWSGLTLEYFKDDKWLVKSNTGSPIFNSDPMTPYLDGNPLGPVSIQNDDTEPYIVVAGSNSGSLVQINGTFTYTVRFASAVSYAVNALDVNNNTLAVGISNFDLKEVSEYA